MTVAGHSYLINSSFESQTSYLTGEFMLVVRFD